MVISNISENGAETNGTVQNTGGTNITARGTCYIIFSIGDPTTSDFKVEEKYCLMYLQHDA